MNKQKSFKDAEALGELKTMPELADEASTQDIDLEKPLENPDDFRMGIAHAQMEGRGYVEVTEKLFKYLLKRAKSEYLTYGDPGIKVFLQGTREGIEERERMNAEQYNEYVTKKKSHEAQNKINGR